MRMEEKKRREEGFKKKEQTLARDMNGKTEDQAEDDLKPRGGRLPSEDSVVQFDHWQERKKIILREFPEPMNVGRRPCAHEDR